MSENHYILIYLKKTMYKKVSFVIACLLANGMAIAQDDEDVVLIDKSVIEAPPAPVAYRDNNKPFKKAVINNNYEAVLTACETYCNIDEKLYQGNTALHLAAKFNSTPLYLFLLENKAKYTANQFGETPLHFAAYAGNVDIMERIIEREGIKSILAITKNKQNALFYSFKNDKLLKEAPLFLLKKGIECNDVDSLGQTPMHYAMYSQYSTQYMSYYKQKCDLFIENADQVRPIDLAYRYTSSKFDRDSLKQFESMTHVESKNSQ